MKIIDRETAKRLALKTGDAVAVSVKFGERTLLADLEINENYDEEDFTPIRVNEYGWELPDNMDDASLFGVIDYLRSCTEGLCITNSKTPFEYISPETGDTVYFLVEKDDTYRFIKLLGDGDYVFVGWL